MTNDESAAAMLEIRIAFLISGQYKIYLFSYEVLQVVFYCVKQ